MSMDEDLQWPMQFADNDIKLVCTLIGVLEDDYGIEFTGLKARLKRLGLEKRLKRQHITTYPNPGDPTSVEMFICTLADNPGARPKELVGLIRERYGREIKHGYIFKLTARLKKDRLIYREKGHRLYVASYRHRCQGVALEQHIKSQPNGVGIAPGSSAINIREIQSGSTEKSLGLIERILKGESYFQKVKRLPKDHFMRTE